VTEAELQRLLEELDRDVQSEPKAWEVWAARGWCRHLLGDGDAALADLKRACDLHPTLPGLWALRGSVALRHQRLDEAEAMRQRLAGWQGIDVAVWHSAEADACEAEGNLAAAHWHLSRLLDSQPSPSVALLLRRGRLSLARGQEKEAAADFARAVQQDEKDLLALWWHARTCLASGDQQGYRRSCAALLKHFAAAPEVYKATVVVRTAMLAPDAVADLAAALKLLPGYAHTFNQTTRGGLLLRAGKPAEAIAELQKKASWPPSREGEAPVTELLLALAYRKQGKAEEARRALATARFVLERETPLRRAGLLLGSASGGSLHALASAAVPPPPGWDWPTALEVRLLQREAQLLADDPATVQNEEAWLLATAAEAKLRDPARAVKLAKQAVERAPEQRAYWKTLGVAQYRAGDWKAAVAALDKAMPPGGGDSTAGLFRAMARWQLGQREQARQEYAAVYGQAIWQAIPGAKDEDFPRFRDEAHVLLGLPRLAVVRRVEWPGTHVYHTAFSPDSRSYLAGGDVGPLRLWDVETGKQLQEFQGHEGWTSQAAFTPDGKQVLSAGTQDKCLRLWDVATGKQVRAFTGHTADVLSVAVSPDGRLALSGSADKTLRLWELATGKEVRKLEGHADRCWGIFSPDGRQVLSFSEDKTLRLWEAGTGKPVRTLAGHTGPVAGAWFLRGGKQVVSHAADYTLRVSDVETGKEVRRFGLGADHCAINWLALTPDGRGFLTNHQDLTVRWHDLATFREWHRVAVPPGASPQGLSVSPDGRYAADGSFRGFVYLFRLAGGEGVQPEKPEKQAERPPGR
jgi:tetratricopeptide (TPR) repeat protein